MNYGKIITHAVQIAETLYPNSGSGPTKREWVINFVNDQINIPFLNERQEASLIGGLVDAIVEMTINDGSP